MSEYVETSEKDVELLESFSNNKYIQKSVKLLKDKYKEKYGFSNDKVNTERLFPVLDPLNMSYKELYDMFCDIYNDKCKKFLYLNTRENKPKSKMKTIFDTEFEYGKHKNNLNSLLMNSQKLPNFLQMIKYSNYTCDDITYFTNEKIYLNIFPPVKDKYDIGNNFSSGYLKVINPNLNLNNSDCNEYLSNEFDPYSILNSMDEKLKEYSKVKKHITFMDIFSNIFSRWIISKSDTLGYGGSESVSLNHNINDILKNDFDIDKLVEILNKYTFMNGNFKFEKEVIIQIIKDFYKIFPFYCSSFYNDLVSSPMAIIFSMAFNIMLLKRLWIGTPPDNFGIMKDMYKIFDMSIESIKENKKIKLDISEVFNQIYFKENLYHLKDKMKVILKSLYSTEYAIDNTYIGKDSFSFNNIDTSGDTSVALTSLIELFSRFDNDVKWFDFSIFEVDVNEENKDVLKDFSECLLESVLIYKNSLLISDTSSFELSIYSNDKLLFKHNEKYFLRKSDITCTMSKTNHPAKYSDEGIYPKNVFSSMNIMMSLANSINICVENYNDNDSILTNSQMKRNGIFTDLYAKYSKLFIYETKKYLSDKSISFFNFTVDTEKEAFLYVFAMDMIYQIKTWYFDSYYFWRTFKKFSKLSERKNDVFLNLFSKYFYDKEMPINMNINGNINICFAAYPTDFANSLTAGIYFYSSMILYFSYFYENIPDNFVLECYSRIVMKDLYIFGDKEKNFSLSEYSLCKNEIGGSEGFIRYPMIIKDKYFQKILNSFKYGTSMFEKILADTYIKWFMFGLLPNIDNNVKNMIYELIPSFEYSDTDISKYFIENNEYDHSYRYFALDIVSEIISQLDNINNILFLSHLCYCQKFLMVNNMIIKNMKKYNNYSIKDNLINDITNDTIKSKIFGKIIIPLFLKNSDNYNIFKFVNILESMVLNRIGNSLDDYDYSSCCGLPLTLFYKNSINILIENIFTCENLRDDRFFIPSLGKSKTILLMYDIIFNYVDMIKKVMDKDNYNENDIISIVNGILMSRNEYYNDPEMNSKLNEIFNFDKEFFIDFFTICGQYSNFEKFSKCIVTSVLKDWDYKQFKRSIIENVLGYPKYLKVKNSISDGIGKFEYIDYSENNIPKVVEDKKDNNLKVIENENKADSDSVIFNGYRYSKKYDKNQIKIHVPLWGRKRMLKFKSNNMDERFENMIKYISFKGDYFIIDGFKK